MIDGDYELWTGDSIHKDVLITDGTVIISGETYSVSGATVAFENDLIESESLDLVQSLCSKPQIQFGSCEAGSIKFTVYENVPGLKGKKIKVYLIPNHEASKMLQLGEFTITDDKLSADRTKREITGYDDMYKVLNTDVASWYNTLLPNSNSSMTLAQFRASLLSYLNITAESTTLVNDSITIKRTIEPESLSGADAIRCICELNGVFGQITNEGKFRFVELSPDLDAGLFPSDTLYPANDLYPQDVNHSVDVLHHSGYIDGGLSFEDWNVESITGLTIRTNDKDVGVTVGTTSNCYVITANFLVYGYNATNLRTVATNALSKMTNRYYRPCSVQAVGNPLHEVGDGIRIRTQYRGIVTYILERRLTGIQALRDTYTANGEQKFTEQLNSVSSMFKQLEGKTMSVEADVDHFKVTVEQKYVSKDGIVGDLDNKMSSSIEVTANRIAFNSTGSLVVNTTNFKLDEDGNADFSGDITASNITGSTISGTMITSENTSGDKVTIVNGSITNRHTNGSNWMQTIIYEGVAQFSASFGGVCNIGHTGMTVSTTNHSTTVAPGSITVDGNNVLTSASSISRSQLPSTIDVDTIYASSGNTFIAFEGSTGSSYDIVLGGSVNIGNGPTNTIRIKGKDVKWQQLSIGGTTYNVLVED